MRDLWLICERCCCEEPCLIFIGGGGQTCERQKKPCVTHDDGAMEWWRPLTKDDIKEYNLSMWGMDDPPTGVITMYKDGKKTTIDENGLISCTCGHKVKIHTIALEYPYRIGYCVSCMGCGRYSGWFGTEDEAKRKWNQMMCDEQTESSI